MVKWIKKNWKLIISVLVGNLIYALSVKLFLLPSNLITGGTTGIALTVNHFFDIPIPTFVLIFNVIMLIIGGLVLGKKFAASTVACTFLYPIFLQVCDMIFGDLVISNDMMLCTIFTGLGIGLSLGIVIRAGASTGGMDIPPLILNKKLHIPVSISLNVLDFCIIATQMFFRPIENVLYGILLVAIYTLVLDKMLLIGTTKTEVKVVSEKAEEIRKSILTEIDRGVTILYGKTGYLQNDTEIILSVISNRELPKLEKCIHEIDPESFLIVSRVSEVRGRGFTKKKKYKEIS